MPTTPSPTALLIALMVAVAASSRLQDQLALRIRRRHQNTPDLKAADQYTAPPEDFGGWKASEDGGISADGKRRRTADEALVEDYLAARNRADVDAAAALCDDDFEMISSRVSAGSLEEARRTIFHKAPAKYTVLMPPTQDGNSVTWSFRTSGRAVRQDFEFTRTLGRPAKIRRVLGVAL